MARLVYNVAHSEQDRIPFGHEFENESDWDQICLQSELVLVKSGLENKFEVRPFFDPYTKPIHKVMIVFLQAPLTQRAPLASVHDTLNFPNTVSFVKILK